MLNQQQAITLFQSFIEEAKKLKKLSMENNRVVWEGLVRWNTICADSIAQVFGEGSRNLLQFQGIKYVPIVNGTNEIIAYTIGLDIAVEQLEGMLLSIQLWWQSSLPLSPNIFISCGGNAKKSILPKLKELILALGMTPIIVEEQPSYNLAPSDKIKSYLDICNAGIALISSEDVLKSGELNPRDNVVHEIGRMQENTNIGGRIIYLKENDVKLSSNLSVTWIPFNRSNFEACYPKLIRDIRAFLS